ncbi:MAG: glycosyltransferase family 2 protein [Promethearchaeota archaeon]|jgi:glycosyltransferase involved in cell wall biosynthesis
MINTTVVISNYNYDRYLAAAIDSCLGQTVPCRIIVVDDASTDNSWKVLQRYKDKIINIRLKENSGGNARGKNIGIALSETLYVTCLDSDDILLPDSIEQRLFFDGVDFVHGWTHFIRTDDNFADLQNNEYVKNKTFRLNPRQIQLAKQAKADPSRWAWAIHGNTVLAKRELYERFGLYDEEMNWKVAREMWYRWLSHGVTFRMIEEFVAVYRKHGKNTTTLAARKEGPKNAQFVTALLRKRKEERKKITKENTQLLTFYDPMVYIDEMEGSDGCRD